MGTPKKVKEQECLECGQEDVALSEEGLCPVCDAQKHEG